MNTKLLGVKELNKHIKKQRIYHIDINTDYPSIFILEINGKDDQYTDKKECEGCHQIIDQKEEKPIIANARRPAIKGNKSDESEEEEEEKKQPSETSVFFFHDKFCVSLRRLKESIRKMVIKELCGEIGERETYNINIESKILRTLQEMKGILEKTSDDKYQNNNSEQQYMDKLTTNLEESIPMNLSLNLDKNHENSKPQSALANSPKLSATDPEKAQNVMIKWKNIPRDIKNADMNIFGESLVSVIIDILFAFKIHSDALGVLLEYIFDQKQDLTETAFNILKEKRTYYDKKNFDSTRNLWSKIRVDNLDTILTAIIQSSSQIIPTALYWSVTMNEEAKKQWARKDELAEYAKKYVEFALDEINKVNREEVLSLLLEIPTNINGVYENMSALEMAVKYELIHFTDNARIQMAMSHMWSEFEYLDPDENYFRSNDLSLSETLGRLLTKNPAKFYYCPIGRYWTDCVMYLVYVAIVTAVVSEEIPNLQSKLSTLEMVLVIFTGGYFAGEIQQLCMYGKKYFSDISNVFDICILLIWIGLGLIRFSCSPLFGEHDCKDDNSQAVLAYMFLFCVQICILWTRIALMLVTNKTFGPFISMIPGMVKDILNWLFVLAIFFVGFTFGVNFIINGDIDEECRAGDRLSNYSLVFEFVFISLMGQSDWSALDENNCMSQPRSLILKISMWIFAVMGTILLLNLLIAMMASTYDRIREHSTVQVNYSRAELVYLLSRRFSVQPAPLNLVVFTLWILFMFIEIILFLVSGICCCCFKHKYSRATSFSSMGQASFTESIVSNNIHEPYGAIELEPKNQQHAISGTNNGKFKIFNIENILPVSIDYHRNKTHKKKHCCNLFGVKTVNYDNYQEMPINDGRLDNDKRNYAALSVEPMKCFVRYDSYKAVSKLFWDENTRYCGFCRHRMEKNEEFKDVNQIHENNENITSDLKDEIRNYSSKLKAPNECGFCPKCWRPFRKNDRLKRRQVICEILSFWLFMVTLYLPLILIIAIPAILTYGYSWFNTWRERKSPDFIFNTNKKENQND